VALLEQDRLLGEYLFSGAKAHSQRLLGMIDRLLTDSGCSIGDIDLFAVSLGPGSFTGLRVGISTAQGLALAAGRQIAGIPTLEALAFQARGCCDQICPMVTARGQEVFTAHYRTTDKDGLVQVREETVIGPEAWLAGISGETVFLGSGAVRHRKTIEALLGAHARVLPFPAGLPRASAVAALALARFAGEHRYASETIAPRYIKAPDAECPAGRPAGIHPGAATQGSAKR
jgi:tRNA threonylcarbamoyladenosine biosynthesis protein TsaB